MNDLSEISLTNISLNATINDFCDSTSNKIQNEVIEQLMGLYLRHNLTKIAVEDVAKLINKIPGGNVKIPTTKYLIFKEFLSNSTLKVDKYILCKNCKIYSKHEFFNNKNFCDVCKSDLSQSKETFTNLSVAIQLKKIISNHFDEIIEYKETICNKTDDLISDIWDGFYIKNILQKGHFYSMTFNTDGVVIHSSSKQTFWPLLLICNFLPPALRFKEKNIIVGGIYYGIEKPNFNSFILPLVEEFQQLSSEGIVMNSELFKFHVTHASLDLPAKAVVQNITQYNGYNACSYCKHPGEKTSKGVRYTLNSNCPTRDHTDMIATIQRVLTSNKVVLGIKGLSPLIGFQNFDLVKSFTIDYMHGLLLGVTKNMLSFWWDSENHNSLFYITQTEKRYINQRIKSIKPCRFINRKINSLDDYKQFKASQFRHFLLYFHPVLNGFLKKKYYEHFRLLSSATYILLKSTITQQELINAEENIQKFVENYQVIYGKTQMTMNVHNLLHLIDCVKHMGPLWSYSMFSFESFNFKLKRSGKDSTNVTNQIIEKIAIECSNVNTEKIVKVESGLGVPIMPQEKNALQQRGFLNVSQFYATYKKKHVLFTSDSYTKARQTRDCYVSFSNGTYGKIKFYFKQCESSFALIEELKVVDQFDHFKEVQPSGTFTVQSVDNIIDKYMFMMIGLKNIIVNRPNSFEVN